MGFDIVKSASSRCALVAGLALAGCGGGGGGSSPDVWFSFASSTTTLAEDDPSASVQVVLHTTLPALVDAASVDVTDAGTGTATAGSDYTTFPAQTLTFPAGSLDGDIQTVTLDPLDDLLVEAANQTARLRLQNPVDASLSGFTTFTATITDIHVAEIGFATGTSLTPDESSTQRSVALELQLDPGVTLGVAVSAHVADLHTGSATSNGDYSVFAIHTVTFPIGSGDGAIQTVSVQVIDDASVETNETVELGLSTPSAGTALATMIQHALSIQDDDDNPPFFVGTEGPAGTGNALTYDELLNLGSQTVGAGPNTGTLVRITNTGGTGMDLGAPSVTGTHLNDFAVEIDSAPDPLAESERAALAPARLAPLVALPDDGGPGVALALDRGRLAELATQQRATWYGVVVPALGPVTLELRRRPLPFTDDAVLRIDGQDVAGGPRTLVGDLQIWIGSALEFPDSHVFLALSSASVQGYLELADGPERTVHFLPDPSSSADTLVVRALREPELQALGMQPPVDVCAGERFVPGRTELASLAQDPAAPGASALTVADCRVAFESDFNLFQKFASSTALTTYVTQLIAAVSAQYFTDIQTNLSIAYLGIHTNSNDGWTTQEAHGNASDLLDEFKAAWGQDWPVTADLAHFLSGASLGGGVAYVNVLCSPGFGFGVSGNLTGTIDWSAWTGQPSVFTWDFVVVAHEIGHNFGSQHTHSYCPPLDQCSTNCTGPVVCSRGTIMSYCHTCGGMSNVDLHFHPVCANIMRQRVNSSCLDAAVLAAGDFVQYRVRFNPLTATGVRNAALTFTHDATNVTQPFRLQLRGTGN